MRSRIVALCDAARTCCPGWRGDDLEERRQSPRRDREPGLSLLRGEGEGVCLPEGVLLRILLLDGGACLALPAPVRDLPQGLLRRDRQPMRLGEDPGGLHRAAQGTRVDGGDRLAGQTASELANLIAARVGERHVGFPREGVLGGERRCSVADQVNACGGHPFTLMPFPASSSRSRSRWSPCSSIAPFAAAPPVPHVFLRSRHSSSRNRRLSGSPPSTVTCLPEARVSTRSLHRDRFGHGLRSRGQGLRAAAVVLRPAARRAQATLPARVDEPAGCAQDAPSVPNRARRSLP